MHVDHIWHGIIKE